MLIDSGLGERDRTGINWCRINTFNERRLGTNRVQSGPDFFFRRTSGRRHETRRFLCDHFLLLHQPNWVFPGGRKTITSKAFVQRDLSLAEIERNLRIQLIKYQYTAALMPWRSTQTENSPEQAQ